MDCVDRHPAINPALFITERPIMQKQPATAIAGRLHAIADPIGSQNPSYILGRDPFLNEHKLRTVVPSASLASSAEDRTLNTWRIAFKRTCYYYPGTRSRREAMYNIIQARKQASTYSLCMDWTGIYLARGTGPTGPVR